jgi:GGDEF domain-containing protein
MSGPEGFASTGARYGGVEFLVILAECNGRNRQVVLDRIDTELKDWNNKGQLTRFELGLSIGAAEWEMGKA